MVNKEESRRCKRCGIKSTYVTQAGERVCRTCGFRTPVIKEGEE